MLRTAAATILTVAALAGCSNGGHPTPKPSPTHTVTVAPATALDRYICRQHQHNHTAADVIANELSYNGDYAAVDAVLLVRQALHDYCPNAKPDPSSPQFPGR